MRFGGGKFSARRSRIFSVEKEWCLVYAGIFDQEDVRIIERIMAERDGVYEQGQSE
jgi:hypothetical protein